MKMKRSSSKTNSHQFKPGAFLEKVEAGRTTIAFRAKKTLFSQGDPADAVFYVHKGKIKLTVLSTSGREAVVGMLSQGDFFGEGSLAGQRVRMATATAIADGSVERVEKKAMVRLLHQQPVFSDIFMTHLLSRNIRIEEDLVDQLFNSSEKRLARILILLSRIGAEGDESETVVPHISQETLAAMIGTTRARVSFFMNRFRKMGFIEYNGKLRIHGSLVNIVLHD
ncbi:MAG TPA: Crp/Fnr family transcriptional regulator [bacterium]|nr:Crp/Fnr family transcriptional regulator [bacterium]